MLAIDRHTWDARSEFVDSSGYGEPRAGFIDSFPAVFEEDLRSTSLVWFNARVGALQLSTGLIQIRRENGGAMDEHADDIKYRRPADIPPETPIPLTQIGDANGRYSDHGVGMYCSVDGKQSARRARSELWAIRHKTRTEHAGPVWFYCADHMPNREWNADVDGRTVRAREVNCNDCFLVVPVGSICEETGQAHQG